MLYNEDFEAWSGKKMAVQGYKERDEDDLKYTSEIEKRFLYVHTTYGPV